VALAVLAVLDLVSSLFYRTGTTAGVTTMAAESGSTERAFVILPGHTLSGDLVARAFAPYRGAGDAFVAVDYAERGVDPADIYRQVRTALAALQPQHVVVYGPSLGGLVSRALLAAYAADGMPYGRVDLVLDSGPSQESDVRRPGLFFETACRYPGGMVSTALWGTGSAFATRPDPEPDADPAQVAAGQSGSAWVGTSAVASQACYIRLASAAGADDDRQALAAVVARAVFLQGTDPQDDPLIDVPRAVDGWRQRLPQLQVVTIATRPAHWHLPIVERPHETMTAMTAALAR
jgi:pimeloyl-ACP methyl ester carboxylesterase